jgi:hypothetical protein
VPSVGLLRPVVEDRFVIFLPENRRDVPLKHLLVHVTRDVAAVRGQVECALLHDRMRPVADLMLTRRGGADASDLDEGEEGRNEEFVHLALDAAFVVLQPTSLQSAADASPRC